MVWAAAVGLIAYDANRNRRPAAAASREAPAYLRTLGLITYPLYLTHNVIGAEIIHALINAGLNATAAVWCRDGYSRPGLLVHLYDDRASYQRRDDESHFVFRIASGKNAGIEAHAVFQGVGPSTRPRKDDCHVVIAGALPDQLLANPSNGTISAT